MKPAGITSSQWLRYNYYFVLEHFMGLERSEKYIRPKRIKLYNEIINNKELKDRGKVIDVKEIECDSFDKYENKTGGGIWLHSVPDKIPLTRGSRGCVVLRNEDIKKIETSILLNKTFLIIDSKIDWVSGEEHARAKDFALEWFNQWRKQWQEQDLVNYIKNYSDEFLAPPFNKKTWLEHKQKLKARYTYVKVNTFEPNIIQLKNQYVIQFVQDYESDGHKDIGVKTLYVIKQGNFLKIKREEWAELKNN